jgi:S1-C subfamily serine protease
MFSIEQIGIEAAEKTFHEEYGGRGSLAAHLRGKLSFLAHVKGQTDPVFRSLAVRFNNIFSDWQIKVTPTRNEVRDRATWIVENDVTINQGTAFFLNGVGLITAAHCVSDTNEVEVFHPSRPANRFKASVEHRDLHRDLAILGHAIPKTEYFELCDSYHEVSDCQEVVALGYPGWAPGDKLNTRPGVISAFTKKNGLQLIEVTQMLTQGMSGGPILDTNDWVVGIIHKGGPEEGRNFAIHIEELRAWLS